MINGNTLRDAFISGANNISNNRKKIDELNVFPVPDGDTGTNMSMTIGSSVNELIKLNDAPVGTVAATAATAFLRGARGNSGVILSLLFRGFSKGLKGVDEMDGPAFANALGMGVEAAYKAVMKPTEGTILTVSRLGAEAAKACKSAEFMDVFNAALEGSRTALEQTPELLPVLKKAGVVDAGGCGFITVLEGMKSVFDGNGIIEPTGAPSVSQQTAAAESKSEDVSDEITFTYDVELYVKRDSSVDKDTLNLRAYLESIGDCAAVDVSDRQIVVHVHTDHPGKAIEKALTYGPLVDIKVVNLRETAEKEKEKDASPATVKTPDGGSYTPVKPEKPFGFVSVCVGEGLQSLFADLGADQIVSGGQTMNPSTDDILKAVELTPAETVFVLPNNKNIIMAAELAVPLATRKVIVLHTKTIPMGIGAMLAFDPDTDADSNALIMMKATESIKTGQVTFAARDSDFDGHKIKQGDILALDGGKLSFTDSDFMKATARLAKDMTGKDTGFITVIYGENVTDEQAEAVCDDIRSRVSADIEVTAINGGQPVYYFILSVE